MRTILQHAGKEIMYLIEVKRPTLPRVLY